MATVVWIGSPDGPNELEWMGMKFAKGESIETDNKGLLAKVSGNKFFKVEGYEVPEAKHAEPVTHRPPSETPVAGEVPKAGDPIVREGLQMGKSAPPVEDSTKTKAEDEHHPAVRAAMRPRGK